MFLSFIILLLPSSFFFFVHIDALQKWSFDAHNFYALDCIEGKNDTEQAGRHKGRVHIE
jgi:hypothetical protein